MSVQLKLRIPRVSVYDVFRRDGFTDLPRPLRDMVCEAIGETIARAGYEFSLEPVAGGFRIAAVAREGRRLLWLERTAARAGIDFERDPRRALLALGLNDLVEVLDNLEASTVEI